MTFEQERKQIKEAASLKRKNKLLESSIEHALMVLKMMTGSEDKDRLFVLIQTLRIYLKGAVRG